MRGYHYLMRIGLMLNVLVQFSESLFKTIKEKGLKVFFEFIFVTISGALLDVSRVKKHLSGPIQLRLI